MFDHEKLRVYQAGLQFVESLKKNFERVKKSSTLHHQLNRACTSILLNIAEGKGRYTAADRCRFFDMARGSALECAVCLDLLVVKKLISQAEATEGKTSLEKMVSMLVGLIRSNSNERLHEKPVTYRVGRKRD